MTRPFDKSNITLAAGDILGIFEDFLDENEITLTDNPERDEAIASGECDPDEAAIIYGSLCDYIMETVLTELENGTDASALATACVDNFREMVAETGTSRPITEEEMRTLYDDVIATAYAWGITSYTKAASYVQGWI